jgi:ribosome-associated protein
MQYVGKLMRQLDAATIDAMRAALDEQHNGSAAENQLLHATEQWRERLLADDAALPAWMAAHPATDTQQLRALIRQARKDAPPAGQAAQVAVSQGLAPRKGRAYRELFQLLRAQLAAHDAQPTPIAPGPENE